MTDTTPQDTGLPVLDVSSTRKTDDCARQVIDEWKETHVAFQYGDIVIVPIHRGDTYALFPLTRSLARLLIERGFEVLRRVGTRITPCRPPAEILEAVTDPSWAGHLSPLRGLVTYPVMHNGKVLMGNIGYDIETQLLVKTKDVTGIDPAQFATPTDAYNYLAHDLLKLFKFATERDRVAALAIPATMLLRMTSIRGAAPIHLITSGESGSGKSTLMNLLVQMVRGSLPDSLNFSTNEEEFAKALAAKLMGSPDIIPIDQIPAGYKLRHDILNAYATTASETMEQRILGQSAIMRIPTSATMMMTGINTQIPHEMATRYNVVRLHHPGKYDNGAAEKLEQRIEAERGKILSAFLRILSAQTNLESGLRFKAWEKMVVHPLIAASGVDFTTQWRAMLSEGEEHPGLEELLEIVDRLPKARMGATKDDFLRMSGKLEREMDENGNPLAPMVVSAVDVQSIAKDCASALRNVVPWLTVEKHPTVSWQAAKEALNQIEGQRAGARTLSKVTAWSPKSKRTKEFYVVEDLRTEEERQADEQDSAQEDGRTEDGRPRFEDGNPF